MAYGSTPNNRRGMQMSNMSNSNRNYDDLSRHTLGTENSERDALGIVPKKPSKAQELMQQIMPTFVVNQEQFTDAATANDDFGDSEGPRRADQRNRGGRNNRWDQSNDDSPFKLTKLDADTYQPNIQSYQSAAEPSPSHRGGARSTRSHGSKGSRRRSNKHSDSD